MKENRFDSKSTISHTETSFTNQIISNDFNHIALGFDDNYAMPAGIAVYSVIKNNPESNLHFHLFVDNVSEENIAKFKSLANQNILFSIYHINDKFQINPETLVLKLTPSTCIRFVMPDILKDVTKQFLYIDSDVLCLGSIEELFNMQLEPDVIAGVIPDEKSMQEIVETLYPKEIDATKYFNAGVLLINTEQWMKNDITTKSMQMINSGKVYRFADQDVLNFLLAEKIQLLPIKYNRKISISTSGCEEKQIPAETKILHYVTLNKPWLQTYHSELFDSFFYNSPWKNTIKPLAYKNSSIRNYAKFCLYQGHFLKTIKFYWFYFFKNKKYN